MRKKIVALLVAVATMLMGVGVTLAFLMASSRPVINVFTVGNIQLSLTETTGDEYQMIPGVEIQKDPHLTVKANSDSCWLFFKAEETAGFDRYMTYAIADGWTALAGEEGIYYRLVAKTSSDRSFGLLANNKVAVKDTVTEEGMSAVNDPPVLTFYGYAIQHSGIDSAAEAWQQIQDKEEVANE